MRIGMGYDVHRLVEGRKLILGGVEIPYEKGLLGHSDADVLVHAVMDALLGAAALGDIGQHFPDTDPRYEGISSIELLKKVGELLEEKGYVRRRQDEKDKRFKYIYLTETARQAQKELLRLSEIWIRALTKDMDDALIETTIQGMTKAADNAASLTWNKADGEMEG